MSFLRAAKYYTKGYSEIQTKVRDATSNADQPPTGRMLNEISQMSFDQECFRAIVEILDKRLNDTGKNWRHVYKSLLVLDYLLHSGSEAIVLYFKSNAYLIKTLTDFQYIDEGGKDHGVSVRTRAKDIANLLSDEARLRQTRRNRAEMRDRMLGKNPRSSKEAEEYENENAQRRSVITVASAERSPTSPRFNIPTTPTGNSDDSRRSAIAAIRAVRDTEDRHLLNAFKFSHAADEKKQEAHKEEEKLRSFDDIFAPEPEAQLPQTSQPIQVAAVPSVAAAAPTIGADSVNPFPLIVLDDEAATNAPQPPQLVVTPTTSTFNPFYQQQAQFESEMQQQAELQRQQQEWMHAQAVQEAQMQAQQQQIMAQQMETQQMAQQAFFQQQMSQQQVAPAQTNNPWIQSQQQASQPITVDPWGLQTQTVQWQPEQTWPANPLPSPGLGSKNPFLAASSSAASVPSLYTSFSSSSSSLASPPLPPTPSTPSFPPSSPTLKTTSDQSKFKVDTDQFESIFASRSDNGMDTFGNVGNLRFGANQHQHLLV